MAAGLRHNSIVQWCTDQLAQGMQPGLSGARLRCQYVTNATPVLVLASVLMYLALFAAVGVPALVRSCLMELPLAVGGVVWFRLIQRSGAMPSYWQACLVCQATLAAGILGGQGTAIDTHFYFLFFALTAPLIVPVADRWSLAVITLECVAVYLVLECLGWAPDPSVLLLSAPRLRFLQLSVVVGSSAILFAAVLLSEQILDRLERQIVQLANTDVLTGLPNRRHFQEMFEGALGRTERGGTRLCLAIIDIDHFKRINDTLGHDAGDEVLQQVAQRLSGALRRGDALARIGGEEFAVIMENTELDAALVGLERMRALLASTDIRLSRGVMVQMTVSVGVARWVAGTPEKAFMETVDQALYAAKRRGRNNVCAATAPSA